MRRLLTLCTLTSVSCLSLVEVPLPEPGPEVGTLLVHLKGEAYEEIWVLEPGQAAPFPKDRIWSRRSELTAYALPWSPQELQLPVGLTVGAPIGPRQLPPASEAWTSHWAQKALEWTPQADRTGLAQLGFAAIDWAQCVDADRCAPLDPDLPALCVDACEGATPAMPLAPAPPQGTMFRPGQTMAYQPTLPDAVPCPLGQRQAFGDSTCSAIASCPSGWPAPLPHAGATWYVELGGGGLGTPSEPFATLDAALAAAGPGDAILIGEGTYPTPSGLTLDDLVLQGRCAERTRLEVVGTPLLLATTGLHLSDLALPSILMTAGSATLERVTWTNPVNGAVHLSGGRLNLREASVYEGESAAILADGGELALQDVVIDRPLRAGLHCRTTARCQAERLVVRGTRLQGNETSVAVLVEGSTLDLSSFLIEDSPMDGLIADQGARLTARQGLIRDLGRVGENVRGQGVMVLNEAEAQLDDVMVQRVTHAGFFVQVRGVLTAQDIVIQDTQGPESGSLFVIYGSEAQFERLHIEEPRAPFLYTFEAAVRFEALDATMISSAPKSDTLQALLHLDAENNLLQRVALTSAGPKAIDTTPNTGAIVRLVDVHTEGGFESLRINRSVTMTGTRLQFNGATNGAIVTANANILAAPSELIAQDVQISISQGTALRVTPFANVALNRFVMRAPGVDAGVVVEEQGQLSLSNGRIEGPKIGILLQDKADTLPHNVLRSVQISADTRLKVD